MLYYKLVKSTKIIKKNHYQLLFIYLNRALKNKWSEYEQGCNKIIYQCLIIYCNWLKNYFKTFKSDISFVIRSVFQTLVFMTIICFVQLYIAYLSSTSILMRIQNFHFIKRSFPRLLLNTSRFFNIICYQRKLLTHD